MKGNSIKTKSACYFLKHMRWFKVSDVAACSRVSFLGVLFCFNFSLSQLYFLKNESIISHITND